MPARPPGKRTEGVLGRISFVFRPVLVGGAIYALLAVFLWVVSGDEGFERRGVTLGGVLGSYAAAVVLISVVVGVFLPIARWRAGRVALGMLGGFAMLFCVGILREGNPLDWRGRDWAAVVVIGGILGAYASRLFKPDG